MTTTIKQTYPYSVRKLENIWITVADDCKLAASIWLPENAAETPVPAILEYLPYRKDDSRAIRDSSYHPYLAGHGYVCIRVDMRGTGASDGILYDEYLLQEQDDALEVLAWIEAQPWCTGKIGVMGISWGGFNGLQIAARRPSQLKAIISVASTDDRYADDVHYRGGCVLASDMLGWACRMFALNALPPDPRLVGDRWRDMWFNRLENTPPYVETWLQHQRRDEYWKHGSVCEDYADIECAVYAIGGWGDAYTNAIPRLLAGLPGPKKGLIGPWIHDYPHASTVGPTIGFLQECLRWFDYWLKGVDNGIMDEPLLRAWIQDSVPPAPHYEERPGRWVAETQWPPPDQEIGTYFLNDGGLAEAPGPATELSYRGSQFAGADGGIWCPYGDAVDFPPDQRGEDGFSLAFTSPPLETAVEILGSPVVTLTLAADHPDALVVVRLCDVAPDGASLMVSRGFLNLTHRDSHEQPEALQPGTFYQVRVQLNAAGHHLPAGHAWRVTVSPTYWPMAWPSPHPVTVHLRTGEGSRLHLPLRHPKEEDDNLPPFQPAEKSEPMKHERTRYPTRERTVRRDVGGRKLEIVDTSDHGHTRLAETDLEMYGDVTEKYIIMENDPLSADIEIRQTLGLRRKDWDVRAETFSAMSADAERFYLINVMNAYEGNTRVFAKTWSKTIPRHMV